MKHLLSVVYFVQAIILYISGFLGSIINNEWNEITFISQNQINGYYYDTCLATGLATIAIINILADKLIDQKFNSITLYYINLLQVIIFTLANIIIFESFIASSSQRVWNVSLMIRIISKSGKFLKLLNQNKKVNILLQLALYLYALIRFFITQSGVFDQLIIAGLLILIHIECKNHKIKSDNQKQKLIINHNNNINNNSFLTSEKNNLNNQKTKDKQSEIGVVNLFSQKQIQDSGESIFLQNIKDTISVGIFILNAQQQVIFQNKALMVYTNCQASDDIINHIQGIQLNQPNYDKGLAQDPDQFMKMSELSRERIISFNNSMGKRILRQSELQVLEQQLNSSPEQKAINNNKKLQLSENQLQLQQQEVNLESSLNNNNNNANVNKIFFNGQNFIKNIRIQKINQTLGKKLYQLETLSNVCLNDIMQTIFNFYKGSESSSQQFPKFEDQSQKWQTITLGQDQIQQQNTINDAQKRSCKKILNISDEEVVINFVNINGQYIKIKLQLYSYDFYNTNGTQTHHTHEPFQDFAILMICEDVTTHMQVKEFQSMNNFKMKIIASISHKLKTPLNCSIMLTQMLIDNEIVEEEILQTYIKPSQNSNIIMHSFINDICDYAQIEQNTFAIQICDFCVENIIQECVTLFEYQANMKHLALQVQLDPICPEVIRSDPNRLRQILINLLSNSIRFTNKGQITISTEYLKQKQILQVSITDTGVGISKEEKRKIFEDWGMNGDYKNGKMMARGAGFGLTIADKLVKVLSGNLKIDITSKLNQGSTFSFYIKNIQDNNQSIKMYEPYWELQHQQLSGTSKDHYTLFFKTIGSNSQYQNSYHQRALSQYGKEDREKADQNDYDDEEEDDIDNIVEPQSCDIVESDLMNKVLKINEFYPQISKKRNKSIISKFKKQQSFEQASQADQQSISNQLEQSHIRMSSSLTYNDCRCANILIVDDEMFNIYALKQMFYTFNNRQYVIDQAVDGQQGIELVKKKLISKCCKFYKLIIMDIDMPIKNGYEATDEIIKLLKAQNLNEKVQIVICSAYQGDHDNLRAKELGINNFLNKPVNKDKLLNILATLKI